MHLFNLTQHLQAVATRSCTEPRQADSRPSGPVVSGAIKLACPKRPAQLPVLYTSTHFLEKTCKSCRTWPSQQISCRCSRAPSYAQQRLNFRQNDGLSQRL